MSGSPPPAANVAVRAGDLGDDLGDLADRVVLVGRADVEGLVVDQLARRFEHRQRRARDVLDVHERAPRRAVALEHDLAGRVRPADEVVDHDVEAQARRDAVGGRVAQVGRAEGVVGERRDVLLGQHLGLAVGASAARSPAVSSSASAPAALPYRLHEEKNTKRDDAGLLGLRGELGRGDLVDVVGGLRVEVADRVVADRREVQDGVEALEIRDLDVADVLAQRLDLGRRGAEHARGEQIRVEPDDVVAGSLGERDEDGADVAVVTGDKNAQGTSWLQCSYGVDSLAALRRCEHAAHVVADPAATERAGDEAPGEWVGAQRRSRRISPRSAPKVTAMLSPVQSASTGATARPAGGCARPARAGGVRRGPAARLRRGTSAGARRGRPEASGTSGSPRGVNSPSSVDDAPSCARIIASGVLHVGEVPVGRDPHGQREVVDHAVLGSQPAGARNARLAKDRSTRVQTWGLRSCCRSRNCSPGSIDRPAGGLHGRGVERVRRARRGSCSRCGHADGRMALEHVDAPATGDRGAARRRRRARGRTRSRRGRSGG